jgi:tRNA G18 (ribose-2'-O)-methylase SpoU
LGIYLDVTAGLNLAAKKAFWIFESIDPATGLPPADANVGFLAVNDTNTHVGEGFVDYTITPKSTAVTGDSIRAVAEIVFDNNPALLTPKIHNLIDAVAPTSGIRPLPSLLDSVNIPITKFGEDDSAASGFAAWDLYVSENGGPYTLHAQGITDSVTTYRGNYGHEYRFYTLGLDNVSNKEDTKTTADLTVTIAPDEFLHDLDSGLSLCALDTIDIKWNYLNIPSFDLEYTADSGATFSSVAQNLDPADSIYSWIIPASIQGKKDYWIRAVATSTSTPIDTSRFFELKEIPDLDLGPDTSFCDGTAISLVLNSGGGFTSYLWSTSDTTSSYTATSAGTYSLKVGNSLGCFATDEVVIGTYLLPEISSKTITDATCNGASDGAVSITVVSGHAPYTFSWSSGDSTQNISGKTAGSYIVTITDSVQCVTLDTSTIGEPNVLASSPVLKHVSCFGGSDAEIDLNTSGGTAPYSYVWSNSDTTEKITGLAKGTFTVITTDANNCVHYDTITITEPSLLVASHSTDSVSCYQGSDGSVNLTVSGGTTSYSYLWSNSDTTQDISGLTEGTYSVIVTDANGCLAYDTAIVHEPLELQASASLSHVSCNGGSDGRVDLSVTGGTTSYTYLWSNTATTQDIGSLTAGTYSVIVTDANNCVAYDTSTITEPPALTISHSLTHVSCNGGSDGGMDITVGGGTPGYTYSWSNGDTTQDISSVSAATYNVLVTDANSCTIRDTGTITEPTQLGTAGSLTMVTCNSGTDGEIDLSVTGGTAPYTYVWSTTDTTQDINTLSAGTYSVIVTDANSCVEYDTFVITEPTALSGTITADNISCFGLTDGSLALTMSGGVSPYSYAWSNNDTTASISGLAKGQYTVIVTDANSCLYYDTASITEPAALAISHVVTDVSCKDGSDGEVNITVTGGTTAYGFSWSNGDTTEDISSQTAGTYNVLVTDANGCTIRDTATITEPTQLTSSGSLTMVSCHSGSNGAIDLSVSGGTTPYSYVWSNTDTTQDVSGLTAGTYTVIITDAKSCQQFDTFTITQPTALQRTKTVSNISCFGLTDGTITLSITGGVQPYRYSWSNTDTTAAITGLAKGTYTVVVTDANGCELFDTTTITEPTAITMSSSITHVSCNGGSDGAVDLTTSGGTSPYKWLWSNSDTTEDVSGLSMGSISVIITDDNGCQYFDTLSITEPSLLTSSGVITHIKCNGDATGAVDLTPNGGTSPYKFAWSNNDTTEDVATLLAGTYTVIITDDNSCTAHDTFVLTQPAKLASTVTSIPTSCYDSSDGSALVSVSGGVLPYRYLWNNSDTNAVNANVAAGSYSVIITDGNGCLHYNTVGVTQPPIIQVTKIITPVSCNMGADGKIDLSISGGTPNYSFTWSTTDTTEDVNGLAAGMYSVVVKDDNGCLMYDTSSVTEPSAIVISKLPTHLKCNNDSTGAIDLSVSGGTPAYTYAWSTTDTTQDISMLPAGSYSVIVTDANSCNAYDTTEITQPDSLKASATHTDLECYGDADGTIDLTVLGGTMPYKYNWSNGDTTKDLSGLSGGEFSVIITDSNNCMWFDTVNVVEPAELILVLDSIPEKEGQGNGKAWVTVTGGTGPYEYLWNDPNASTTDTAFNLSKGVYTVTVTDANDCEAMDSILVPMTVGIGIIHPGDVAIYPNPNQGWVGIYNLNVLGDEVNMVITDARGSTVLERPLGNLNDYQLNLPMSMVEGTYIISLYGNEATVRKHMVLIR